MPTTRHARGFGCLRASGHVDVARGTGFDLADQGGGEAAGVQVGEQGGGGGGRGGQEEAAGGLRVVEQHGPLGWDGGVDAGGRADPGGVGPGAAGDHAGRGQVGGAGQQRDGGGGQPGGGATGDQHPVQVAEQAEPGDVGGGLHPGGQGGLAGIGVQRGHRGHGGRHHVGRRGAELDRGGDHAGADGLGQDELVAGRGPVQAQQPGRVGQAHHGQAVLGHLVVDGVAARDHAAGLGGHVGPAAQHLAQQRDVEPVGGPGGQVESEQRAAAHGVHVGQRVGGGDPAPVVRVVDDRGEEVGGQDQGPVAVQGQHRGVVTLGGADEQVSGGRSGGAEASRAQRGEHLLELGQRQLAGAARAGREGGQPGRWVSHHLRHCTAAHWRWRARLRPAAHRPGAGGPGGAWPRPGTASGRLRSGPGGAGTRSGRWCCAARRLPTGPARRGRPGPCGAGCSCVQPLVLGCLTGRGSRC